MRSWKLALRAAALVAAVLWPIRLDFTAQAAATQQSRVKIEIIAERFRFTPDQVRVRRGAIVEFHLESDDTDHGFRIVGTDVDRIIPKRGRGAIDVSFTPEHAGRYTFECSKLCGAGHEFMHGELIVEE
jgi:cytochrome c oxidase subunit II